MDLSRHHVGLARLRGLAALLVVFGHAFHVRSLTPAQFALNPAFLAVSSATVIFVLIAGILFRMKAVPRLTSGTTSTTDILRRRWSELSGTYLTVGLVLAIAIATVEGALLDLNPLLHFLRLMLNGSMAQSYWYVPFFLLLMALTPLHVIFCKLRLPIQIGFIALSAVLSAFIHRPDIYVTWGAFHSLLYYLPVFWTGLIIGAHFAKVLQWLNGKEIYLGASVLCIIALQLKIGQDQVYIHKIGEKWGEVDLFILQKVLFSLVFISLLHRGQNLKMPLIDWLSKHSLIIFFMHPPVLILIKSAPHVSGFYIPELVAVTMLTIIVGVEFHKSLVRIYDQLPHRVRRIADGIKAGQMADLRGRFASELTNPSIK